MKIVSTESSYSRQGAPPVFLIETDAGYPFYAVQVTTEFRLLDDSNKPLRTPSNWFDSWVGDGAFPGQPQEIRGERLQSPNPNKTYTLQPTAWSRLRGTAPKVYYRLVAARDSKRVHHSVSRGVTAFALQGPVSAVTPRSTLELPLFRKAAQEDLGSAGMVSGTDGDFSYVILDARHFGMAVLDCHEEGLLDTVEAMPVKPAAIINGQFIGGSTGIGVATEGQVIRGGQLINRDSQPHRDYLAQTSDNASVADFSIGKGNPKEQHPDARAAFGGLGPLLLNGQEPTPVTPWTRSIYHRAADVGRGIIAIDRRRGRILLLVQKDRATHGLKMEKLRALLKDMGVPDAVFNDGSNSESLFAQDKWLVEPHYLKDEAMDFAIAFVDRRKFQRARMLVLDGTKTEDGKTFASTLARSPLLQYGLHNIAEDLKKQSALASIQGCIKGGVVQTWGTNKNDPQQRVLMSKLFSNAGAGDAYADLMYISGHAWRHGQLWYYDQDKGKGEKQMVFDPWSQTPAWPSTPRWLVLAGCAVLSLHYSRLVKLDDTERNHLKEWHQEIHGPQASIAGLEAGRAVNFCVFHPGWAWYERILEKTGVRGVLGYWHRSPGASVGDTEIIQDFVENLNEGMSFLDAWKKANQRGMFEAEAPWAAMIRENCEKDTLTVLEQRTPSAAGKFCYFDRFQTRQPMQRAYAYANTPTGKKTIGGFTFSIHEQYDEVAMDNDSANLPVKPTPTNVFQYDDGVKPTKAS